MDYEELFEQIGLYLADRGYTWVVEEVREELASGQLTQERISTLAEVRAEQAPLFLDGNFQKGQLAEFVKRAEYTPAEAVALLLEAARRAICDPILMAAEVHRSLARDGIVALSFESERRDGKPFTLSFEAEIDPALAQCTPKLDEIIKVVRTG